MKILIAVIVLVAFAFYFATKLKTGLHILQQESYLNKYYLKWAVNNIPKNVSAADVIPLILFLCVQAIWNNVAVSLIVYSVVTIIAACFCVIQKPAAKKPLVITARVKRLIVTALLLSIVICGALVLVFKTNVYPSLAVIALLNVLSFLFVAAVNIIIRPVELYINHWFVSDAKKKISSMKNLTVVGITGSYGKTSSKFILTSILSEKYHTLCTPESYNTTMGVVRTIREQLTPAHEVFVCEMGAKYVNDIKEICDIVHPSYGVITSIGPQHLETFGSIENIVKTKLELADAVENKENLVMNIASPITWNNRVKGSTAYSCEQKRYAKYWAEDISYGPYGAKFTLCGKDISPVKLETKLLGKHNIENIVGAAAMALKLGVSVKDIAIAVRKLRPVEHRLQMKKMGDITIIDDAFNSNKEGAKSALNVLSSFPEGKRMLITPGMVELGNEEYKYNFEFGAQASEACDFIILVGEKQAPPIKKGLESKNFSEDKLYIAKDIGDAFAKMREIATTGWTVLLENDLPDLYL